MKEVLKRLAALEAHKQNGGVWIVAPCGSQWEATRTGDIGRLFPTMEAARAFAERSAQTIIIDDL